MLRLHTTDAYKALHELPSMQILLYVFTVSRPRHFRPPTIDCLHVVFQEAEEAEHKSCLQDATTLAPLI